MTPLERYFRRIGYAGALRPDLETLRGLMRAHLAAVPFENLDVQLGRPVDLNSERIFEKIVARRRGGWCYEMNGIFGWALGELGFEVARLAGGVRRDQAGDAALGNHLCLLVRLDGRPWLADVGFGGSLLEPLPLEPLERDQPPFRLRLSQAGGGFWRYTEDADGAPFSFDFAPAPADESLLAAKCAWLQSDPASPFVQNLVAQKRLADRHISLRGRVLKELTAEGARKRVLETADELVETLRETFGLDEPDAARLWPTICARHEALFGAQQNAG
ncbi:arylamine N-acetyltransferase family protein [Amphiplicatus metriothermophilus]|uniref:N-hydroxyarylamine O-acetyltransferase n=1 Tax=Amphiplicatus metriothermophilus TaxID=1519374 RepID=A0A239PQE4_9PROT|nr:arylamine N-acetyltransferase [Amphiplicatus metriothermophilus]MBB5518707.1 N-hydroxyarylamine O-acetyltransferase [Amphiplicatus metriothermophilus]SNT72136.1 N-hydroxyarylamine O-acetyltransferase [Amphiplicatus metriothermophilus]